MTSWEGLRPPYRTLLVDPPWLYKPTASARKPAGNRWDAYEAPTPPPYSMMTLDEIAALPVAQLAHADSHLYLWTTNRYLPKAFDVAGGWGFRYVQTLVWCKAPRGLGPGGVFSNTTEFVLFCRRGSMKHERRVDTTWWQWKRGAHSTKPAAFLDIVEQASPAPYVELFARSQRLGWDSWGHGYEATA